MVQQHLQGGRHNKKPGRSTVFKRIEYAIRRKFGEHQPRQPCCHRHNTEASATDVRARHRDQHNFVIIPFGVSGLCIVGMLAQRKQVTVGKDCALRVTRGTGCIKLQHCVVWTCRFKRHALGVFDHLGCSSSVDHLLDMQQLLRQYRTKRFKSWASEHYFCSGIIDDICNFRRSQPPTDRHHDDADAGCPIKQRKV